MTTTNLPTFTDGVYQRFTVEPLDGAQNVFHYLSNFPEEVYHKSPDTHLFKFMQVLFGSAGINLIRQEYLQAKAALEENGLSGFDIDSFFGNPLNFGRTLEEAYAAIDGPQAAQIDQTLSAQDLRYLNRCLDYVAGARAGCTPLGMRLVSKAGLGYDVQIQENYKWIYDQNSDFPLGLTQLGQTRSTEEMIIMPNAEISQAEVQQISIEARDGLPTSGNFFLSYNGVLSGTISYNATSDQMRSALESIPKLQTGTLIVEGGDGPVNPWYVQFSGGLDQSDQSLFVYIPNTLANPLYPGQDINVRVQIITGFNDPVDEIADFTSREQYDLIQALSHIKPVTTIATLGQARGTRSVVNWSNAIVSSEQSEVLRFVTGSPGVSWPTGGPYWIEPAVEIEGPTLSSSNKYAYSGFHEVQSVTASSSSLGSPSNALQSYPSSASLANYSEPLEITDVDTSNNQFEQYINRIYPIEYTQLNDTPTLVYVDQYWQSAPTSNTESLTLELGSPQAVNYLTMDVNRQFFQINVLYDTQDNLISNQFVPVTPVQPYNNMMAYSADQTENTWASVGLTFTNAIGQMIYSRRIQIQFVRMGYAGAIQVRNLRIARNV